MPKPVHQGYFVAIPPKLEFETDYGEEPKGLYLHRGDVRRSFLDYAGLEGHQTRGLQMPGDIKFLRDMADGFMALANDIDRERRGPQKKKK